jgi:hypothetical protein
MCTRFSLKKRAFLLALAAMLMALWGFHQPMLIKLGSEPLPFKPAGFYIAGVVDERPDKSSIGWLQTQTAVNKSASQTVNLQGGVSAAIQQFLQQSLVNDAAQRPIVISVNALQITEKAPSGNRVEGDIKLHITFNLQKDYGPDPLVGYKSSLHYLRSASNTSAIEPQLRKILLSSINYLNNWIKDNSGEHIKLAKQVKITFTNYSEKAEGDTIYYHPNRPLTWSDFQGKIPPIGRAAAKVMPGIAYEQQAQIVDGIVRVSVAMKAYLPKSTCWVNYASKGDAYTLNHEQRHFDIVKIIAEEFKRKVLSEKLTPETYEAFLSMQYLDSYRDMDAMQKAYDGETRHGLDSYTQSLWNTRIDDKLKELL